MLHRRLIVLVGALAAIMVAAPCGAHAQGVGGPLLSPPPEQVDTSPPPPDDDDDGGFGTVEQLLLLGAALALIGGIGFVIVRDARRTAPAERRPQRTDEQAGGPGQARARTRDRDKRRAKAKQARKQRKRTR